MIIHDGMQAIETVYYGPTNTLGARIKATTCSGLTSWSKYDDTMSNEDNHRAAAVKLASKYGWLADMRGMATHLVSGGTARGYAWVIIRIEQ